MSSVEDVAKRAGLIVRKNVGVKMASAFLMVAQIELA